MNAAEKLASLLIPTRIAHLHRFGEVNHSISQTAPLLFNGLLGSCLFWLRRCSLGDVGRKRFRSGSSTPCAGSQYPAARGYTVPADELIEATSRRKTRFEISAMIRERKLRFFAVGLRLARAAK